MSRSGLGFALVGLAALDLRRRPDHGSELASQLLLGEIVRCRVTAAPWLRAENTTDGYSGWVRSWGLVPVTAARARAWDRAARARVTASFAEVREGAGRGALVSPVSWRGRLIPRARKGRYREVELPDGRRGWIESRAIGLSADPARGLSRRSLSDRLRSLMGTPYLWGGRTPMGIDCSAFTQLVLAEQGIRLPRDAKQQYAASRPLSASSAPALGDLAFFAAPRRPPGHVGLVLGDGFYIHARGAVRVSSLDPSNPLFDNALAEQFCGYRRPRVARGQGGPKA